MADSTKTSSQMHFQLRSSGVKRRCIMAPTLFAIYFAAVLKDAYKGYTGQIRTNRNIYYRFEILYVNVRVCLLVLHTKYIPSFYIDEPYT